MGGWELRGGEGEGGGGCGGLGIERRGDGMGRRRTEIDLGGVAYLTGAVC